MEMILFKVFFPPYILIPQETVYFYIFLYFYSILHYFILFKQLHMVTLHQLILSIFPERDGPLGTARASEHLNLVAAV